MSPSIDQRYDIWDSTQDSMGIPADTDIATGNQKNVEVTNFLFGIFDQSSGEEEYKTTLKNWWGNVLPSGTRVFDPKTLYDYQKDQYMMAAVGNHSEREEGYFLLSVTEDGDPWGNWRNWRLTISGHWPDYPGLGVDDKGYYMTANMEPFGDGDHYSRMIAIEKSSFHSGDDVSWTSFYDIPEFTLQPAHVLTEDTDTGEQFFIASRTGGQNEKLNLWKLTAPFSGAPIFERSSVSVNPYSGPPNPNQPDTDDKIRITGPRLMNAVYENGSLWTTHTIGYDWGDGNNKAIIFWYEIDPHNETVINQGGFGREDTYYCFPAIMSNPQGGMFIVYSRMGEGNDRFYYPGLGVAGMPPDKNDIESWTNVKNGSSA